MEFAQNLRLVVFGCPAPCGAAARKATIAPFLASEGKIKVGTETEILGKDPPPSKVWLLQLQVHDKQL
jgi:hypothetical protein